ncbi:hypothetical protein SLEP1_g44176 [Rubroshorea leprosula]|uniref:PGG domain-containing protein n=1 Tax=Rubroshorea leprosula TaxID=152421 RepID=A0AAV5LFD8_9ROSI|nr:hypothetical protein SLEP1_g44176 [Rubroshorea leprosula]
MIVPDVLSESNYEEWSNCMRNYLLAQNLWNVVESSNVPSSTDEEVTADWNRKNAAVLHALQISCAPEIFAQIMGKTSAKEAWEELTGIHEMKNKWHLEGPQSLSLVSELCRFSEGTIPGGETEPIERSLSDQFFDAVCNEKWDAVINLLEKCERPGKNPQIVGDGVCLLHVAAALGNVEGVEKLVQIMSDEEISAKDKSDYTALAYAAYFGKTDIAKCLTKKNKNLLKMPNKEGMIPVVQACVQRRKETTRYLFSETLEFLAPGNGEHGPLLLHFCMLNEMLDIALDLLDKYPRLVFTRFKYNSRELTPILTLSAQTSLFHSGARLSFLRRRIYYLISDEEVKPPTTVSTDVSISVASVHQNEQNDIKRQGINDIRERKLIHTRASNILRLAANELPKLNAEEMAESRILPALFQSIKHGIIEFFKIVDFNPDARDFASDGKAIYSIKCRRREYVRCFSPRWKQSWDTWTDDDGNNVLHIAAKLGPESYLTQFSGAALQMQKELQWFKEFESEFPLCKSWMNHKGETPWQVFTREHKQLLKEAESWMKKTANSYIIVGTLIITIMFAAAFTIPGGNNGKGYPVFSHKRLFLTYIMSDAISLSAASTSVLTFLGILTYPYTEKDFRKLAIGILMLLISVATMMVAFCAAVSIMLPDRWWVVFSLVLLACIPVVVFWSSQSQILIEIIDSIYGPGIFKMGRFFIRKMIYIMREFTGKLKKKRE